jgi:hypothetical protein
MSLNKNILFTIYEDNNKFIYHRDSNYFQRQSVDVVEGENKLAISRKNVNTCFIVPKTTYEIWNSMAVKKTQREQF